MSSAASASPTVVRSLEASSNPSAYTPPPPSYSSAAGPQVTRSRSTNQRPNTTTRHHHSNSKPNAYDAPPQANATALANVARKDFEDTNIPQTSTSRKTSRERRTDYNGDSSRQHRPSSKPGSRRNSQDLTAPTTVVANGASMTAPAAAQRTTLDRAASQSYPNATAGRRRTSITCQTGTWALGKTIGQGSMGKVKLAKNVETGEQVAIKIVPRQTLDDHGNIKDERADKSKEIRTAREAAMVSLLDHPFICGMRDVQRTNYHWYMLFEYVNGGQMLDYIIAHGRLKEKQARKFGRQIASALDYCHRNSIVHRDLKIENILISKTGDIKIIDFGLSNLYAPKSLLKTFCGSLYFAAPELLQARQYTGPEVDVWSFGIVLYVLVCGKVPFDDQSMPQLHAKIKRGLVEYPQWLTAECRSIISRMLVVDPKERATLPEIINHPWMTKGYSGPPDNYLPPREPLSLPLDNEIIEKMQGFDFGSAAYIREQLTRIIDSEDYLSAIRRTHKDDASQTQSVEKKRGVFDFYRRRNSMSREGLTTPSAEAIRGYDPLNAYSPLLSIYYLAQEKRDRERTEANPGASSLPVTSEDSPLKMPGLPSPEAAHTNTFAPEMPGEKSTGGRSRPRARTNGEDEMVKPTQVNDAVSSKPAPLVPTVVAPSQDSSRKESSTLGLLRRFSTRRQKNSESEKQPPPVLNLQPPQDSAATPRKSFSVRRSRRRDPSPSALQPTGSQPQHDALLSAPPASAPSRTTKFLGRSTSVNSADYRPRRFLNRGPSEAAESPRLMPEPPATSGSDRSSASTQKPVKAAESTEPPIAPPTQSAPPRTPTTTRTRSLGHARQESIQARRQRREDARRDLETKVPEETDAELREEAVTPEVRPKPNTVAGDVSKPGGLKGLFSSSTTSNKPPQFIHNDMIRVLKQLNVEYSEIRGGFSCRHAPSINLDDVTAPQDEEKSGRVGHQRRISFGGLRIRDHEDVRDGKLHRHSSRRRAPDQSFVTNSEGSDEYVQTVGRSGEQSRDMAATSTRVQEDTGERLILKFEIAIVKIPLFSLHGIQFKKVQGGMNQYRQMTSTILNNLRL